MESPNLIRFYHYIAGVLSAQQSDKLCRICKAYSNSLAAIKEDIRKFEASEGGKLSGDLAAIVVEARKVVEGLDLPAESEGQKKAGRCRMPEGVCFVKFSKALLDRI